MIVATEKDSDGIMTNIVVHHPNIVPPTSDRNRNPRQNKSNGQVRIVAGQWRGLKINVPDVNGLRPTGDRVRETLFNWLQPYIAGSNCLDLFAGTGALGVESLSRYAASVVFVEPDRLASSNIRSNLEQLGQPSSVQTTTAETFLERNDQRFDIVYIDPPFDAKSQWSTLILLADGHLSTDAMVYMEAPTKQEFPENWPDGYEIHREKRFGDVTARLFRTTELN